MITKLKKNSYFLMILPWIILIISEGFYCHQYFLRVSVSPLSPILAGSMHVKAETIAIIAASFYFAYMGMQLVAGILIDRFGSRIMLTLAAAFCTLGCLLFTHTETPIFAEFSRVLMGAGAAFAFVNTLVLAKAWFNEHVFALINGATLTIGTIGAMLGTTALTKLLKQNDWRDIMLIVSFISLVITIGMWILVRDPDEVIISRASKEHSGIVETLKSSLIDAAKITPVWLNGFYLGFIYIIVSTFASLWCIPYYKVLYGGNSAFVEFSPSLIFIGLGVGALFFSWLSNLLDRPVFIMRIGSVFFLILASFALFCKFPEIIMSIILLSTGFALGSNVLAFVVVARWSRVNCRASAISLTNLLQMSIGAILLPLMGYILDVNWSGVTLHHVDIFTVSHFRLGFLFIIGGAIIASIITFFIKAPSE